MSRVRGRGGTVSGCNRLGYERAKTEDKEQLTGDGRATSERVMVSENITLRRGEDMERLHAHRTKSPPGIIESGRGRQGRLFSLFSRGAGGGGLREPAP